MLFCTIGHHYVSFPITPLPAINAMYIGQEFDNLKSSKAMMRGWALLSDLRKSTFRFKNRAGLATLSSLCMQILLDPFKVNATYSLAKECVTVIRIEEEHNCAGVRPVERCTSSR